MEVPLRAIALLSGGLDSGLAAKLVIGQGVEVIGVKFTSPLCRCDQQGRCFARVVANQLGIPLRVVSKDRDYLQVVRNPRFGYGSGVNPCIDCRIYMLTRTWRLALSLGASFLVTGEVLGQRPMSQRRDAMRTIDRESGLEGKVLRPLSARHLPETEAEQNGWVDRSRMLGLQGRSRKPQLAMARKVGIDAFACAAGGCLLTDQSFAARLRDLFERRRRIDWPDVRLLAVGRHFRVGSRKVIVGRDETENGVIRSLRRARDVQFEVLGRGSPVAVLQGAKSPGAIRVAAALTARYADADGAAVEVHYGTPAPANSVVVRPLKPSETDRLRLPVEPKKRR